MTGSTLVCVGDIVLETAPRTTPLDLFTTADLTFGNLEIVLSGRRTPADKPVTLRCDPRAAHDLRRAGFGVVSLANNHVMDFGADGLADCHAALEAAGVQHVGSGDSLQTAQQPLAVRVGTTRLAFVAFSALLPAGSSASDDRPGVAPLRVDTWYAVPPNAAAEPGAPPVVHTRCVVADLERLGAVIRMARASADLVIVLGHGGVNFQRPPADYQIEVAHACIDAGADVVFGCHNHVIQPCEVYNGRWIFYGLGQAYFISDAPFARRIPREGLAVCLRVDGSTLESVQVVPLELTAVASPTPGEPRLASGTSARHTLTGLAEQSPTVAFEFDGDVAYVRPASSFDQELAT